jgi:RNA polymerase sigma factor (sigma-70 family)
MLSSTATLALLKKAQAGCRAAESDLIAANAGLIHAVARRAQRCTGSLTLDDLLQEGAIGLLRAVRLFQPERGVKFGTFASRLISQQIWGAVHTEQKLQPMMLSLDEQAADGEGDRWADLIEDDRPGPEAAVDAVAVREALRALTPKLALVVRLRYGLDGGEARTLRAVGAALRCSAEAVRDREGQALDRLRRTLNV